MNLLLTAATLPEIKPAVDFLEIHWKREAEGLYSKESQMVRILVSGIGGLATAYSLMRCLREFSAGFAVQAGIAGSFRREITLGEVVLIEREVMGDLGVENGEEFQDLFDTGFLDTGGFPFCESMLCNDLAALPAAFRSLRKVKGISVNTVSGTEKTIRQLENKYRPEVESMEGATFHYVCLQEKIPFLQVRSISNYVELRDKSRWDIPLAVKNLNECLMEWLLPIP